MEAVLATMILPRGNSEVGTLTKIVENTGSPQAPKKFDQTRQGCTYTVRVYRSTGVALWYRRPSIGISPRYGLTIRELALALMCGCHDMHKTDMYVHGSRSSVTASSQVTEIHHDRVASSYRRPVFWSVAETLQLR